MVTMFIMATLVIFTLFMTGIIGNRSRPKEMKDHNLLTLLWSCLNWRRTSKRILPIEEKKTKLYDVFGTVNRLKMTVFDDAWPLMNFPLQFRSGSSPKKKPKSFFYGEFFFLFWNVCRPVPFTLLVYSSPNIFFFYFFNFGWC